MTNVLLLFQHQRFISEARDGEPEVVWIGDSLIQNLFNSRIWDSSFCLMHSVNFGIAGDRTENVLWRLQNGELEDVAPKVCCDHFGYSSAISVAFIVLFQIIVLSVGQENYGDSAETISEGVKSICAFIRSKQPQAFLVLLVGNPKSRCLDLLFTFILVFRPYCQEVVPKVRCGKETRASTTC